MKSLPLTWIGEWIDESEKKLTISQNENGGIRTSVWDNGGVAFKLSYPIKELGINNTINLPSEVLEDKNGFIFLQVETGMIGLGPTFNLYFVVEEGDSRRPATLNDAIEKIQITPTVGMGLYDDWEDDLGVPWAFPLVNFKRLTP